MNPKRIASVIGATLLFSLPATSSQSLDEALNTIRAPETEVIAQDPSPEPEPQATRWAGKNFTTEETAVLNFLQGYGITDRAALATILGNIRQESMFITTICEGGARTGYHGCRSGGFGLIQWTHISRYRGLGNFAKRNGLDPNKLETQLRWMVNEVEWKRVEHVWKTPGKDINTYMRAAHRWLGWGIEGPRASFAHNYYQRLHLT